MKKLLVLMFIALVIAGCGKSEVNNINNCKVCHTSASMLQASASSINPADFLVTSAFLNSPHNVMQCVDCHKGDSSTTSMVQAHNGIVNDPSLDPNTVCANCHAGIVQSYTTSLHYTLAGEKSYLQKISCSYYNNLNTPNKVDCQTCHASCGGCHVQRPITGGLIEGHEFTVASMQDTCNQCHTTQAQEFEGLSGNPPDVHYNLGFQCKDCHSNGIHGDGITYTTMWQVKEMPQCGMCHTDVTNGTSGITEHNIPQMGTLNCTVCHSLPYKNTYDYISMYSGNQYIGAAQFTQTDFRIGLNDITTESYIYTTVRHYPITRDTFDYFGFGLLPGFDLVPTWQNTYPHNIQLITPQNGGDSISSCTNCHNNSSLFLTRDMLDQNDSAANLNIAITHPPPAVK